MQSPLKLSDAKSLCAIYNPYIKETTVTFEEEPVTEDEMIRRIRKIIPAYPWIVFEESNEVKGYVYANRWKERSAYRYSVEMGIYVDAGFKGKGVGSKLLEELLNKLKDQTVHSVISGIALPNPASIALCEKFGFEKVAHFKEVGRKFGQWIDVGYWERVLNK